MTFKSLRTLLAVPLIIAATASPSTADIRIRGGSIDFDIGGNDNIKIEVNQKHRYYRRTRRRHHLQYRRAPHWERSEHITRCGYDFYGNYICYRVYPRRPIYYPPRW